MIQPCRHVEFGCLRTAARPRLILLRHAETTAPRATLLGSRLDPGLSELGRVCARSAAEHLGRHVVARVVCSPLRRARETAEVAFPGVPLVVDDRLAEQDFGELTGLLWEDAKRRYGDRARAWREGRAAAPGGESPAALLTRVRSAAWEAARSVEDARCGEVVLITHSTPIRALVALTRGWGPTGWRRIAVGHGRIRLIRVEASLQADSRDGEPAAGGAEHG